MATAGTPAHDEEYDPLSADNLQESLRRAILGRPEHALPPPKFKGAGVYLLYYRGDLDEYRRVTGAHGATERPIYVGRGASNTRVGGLTDAASAGRTGAALYNRLRAHARSFDATQNIRAADFRCRYLVVKRFWIPLAEDALIREFAPFWNFIGGLGSNMQGKNRRQRRSIWDSLHPGRRQGERATSAMTFEEAWEVVRLFSSALQADRDRALDLVREHKSKAKKEDEEPVEADRTDDEVST